MKKKGGFSKPENPPFFSGKRKVLHSVSQISYVVCESLNRRLGLFTFMKLKLIRSNPKVSNRTLFASNKQMIGVSFPKKHVIMQA